MEQRPPCPLDALIGREEAVADLTHRLSQGRLVTLVGAPGVGKSRLAVQVIWQQSQFPRERVHWLELGERTGAYPLEMPEQLLDAPPTGSDLLVLDIHGGPNPLLSGLLDQLLSSNPTLRVLCVGREPLGLDGEILYQLPPLPVPPPGAPLEALNQSPSVLLFLRMAQARIPSFTLRREEEARVVAEICRRVDGLPLAIKLAAGRLLQLSLSQILMGLEDRFQLLQPGHAFASLPSLAQAIERSLLPLSDPEVRVLRRLALLTGPFSREMAIAISKDAEMTPDRIDEIGPRLVLKSLVERLPDGRYRLLETIRAYLLPRIPPDEREQAEWGLLDHVAALVDRAMANDPDDDAHSGFEAVEEIYPHVESVLANGRAKPRAALLRLCVRLAPYWRVRGKWQEGLTWLSLYLPSAAEESGLAANGYLYLGAFYARLGCFSEAEQALGQSEQIFVQAGDTEGLGRVFMEKGHTARFQGEYAQALSLYERSYEQFVPLGRSLQTGMALSYQAVTHRHLAQPLVASGLYARSLEIFRQIQDPHRVAWVHVLQGNLFLWLRDLVRAERWLRLGLEEVTELQDRWAIGLAHLYLGILYRNRQQWVEAEIHLARALGEFRAMRSPHGEIRTLLALGVLDEWRGDSHPAMRRLDRAASLSHERQSTPYLAMAFLFGGHLLIRTQRYEDGMELCAGAQAILPEVERLLDPYEQEDHRRAIRQAQRALGARGVRAAIQRGRENSIEDGLALLREIGTPFGKSVPEPSHSALSPRETEVARLVARGLTVQEIGAQLFISANTVRTHLDRIYAKTGLNKQTKLAEFARDFL